MNIFIIPSWYPTQADPIAGVFVKEQAQSIADLNPDINVVVSRWSGPECSIAFKKPWQITKTIRNFNSQQCDQVEKKEGVWEVFNPCLQWSRFVPFGGIQRLVSVNRKNYLLASEKFGKIDLIHAHVSYPAGFIAFHIAQEFNIPYVITEHMSPFPFVSLTNSSGKPINEIAVAFSHAAHSIAVSPSLAARIASFGFPRPAVIPNVVDERIFTYKVPSSDKVIFFTLCGITEQKGIDTLLQAIALWDPPASSFEFWIAGDGPMRNDYEKLSLRLSISDRVRWIGRLDRDEVPDYFGRSHIFVMPSRHETFGVVYAEALASGKPVIATRCGGPESIINEYNGRLVDVDDVTGLAKTMAFVANNLSIFDPQKIRQDFERRFSRPAVVGLLKNLYESVIDK
jgi:glycosyltransferase involved in cell wall biosynthesis